ncbi:MAG: hypothetical protein N2V74_03330 [Candidatus Methanospirare jalkutatii]|nr:MAG: hypothetical protein N2V74_02530 [Candidatus Methanospirare jalkutatii]UYZ40742.1 MAG: hypothetical protein N2V74_03330 [Candidatus Methanospirare jalkutatii]
MANYLNVRARLIKEMAEILKERQKSGMHSCSFSPAILSSMLAISHKIKILKGKRGKSLPNADEKERESGVAERAEKEKEAEESASEEGEVLHRFQIPESYIEEERYFVNEPFAFVSSIMRGRWKDATFKGAIGESG